MIQIFCNPQNYSIRTRLGWWSKTVILAFYSKHYFKSVDRHLKRPDNWPFWITWESKRRNLLKFLRKWSAKSFGRCAFAHMQGNVAYHQRFTNLPWSYTMTFLLVLYVKCIIMKIAHVHEEIFFKCAFTCPYNFI